MEKRTEQNQGLVRPAQYGIAEEEIMRLTQIHLQKLLSAVSQGKSREHKMSDITRKAKVMTTLTISSALFKSKNIKDIKNYRDAKDVIFEATGLAEIERWLATQKG